MHAERRQFKLKESELEQKIEAMEKSQNETRTLLSESKKKLQILSAEYSMRMNGKELIKKQNNHNQQQPQQQTITPDTKQLILRVQSLENNNKSLAEQVERYRRELHQSKQTILNCNDTMKQQQQHILKLNLQISELRKTIGLGGSSGEELLQKQIRLLKSQRRMLIQELKDLRDQNEKLKNIIVTGGPTKQYIQ